jgi:hypothetical protein
MRFRNYLQNSKFDLFIFSRIIVQHHCVLIYPSSTSSAGREAFCPRSQQLLQEEVAGFSVRDEWWWVVAVVVKHG